MKLKKSKETLLKEEEQKKERDLFNAVKRRIRSDIKESGVLSVVYKLEYYQNNPNQEFMGLRNELVIKAFETVLSEKEYEV